MVTRSSMITLGIWLIVMGMGSGGCMGRTGGGIGGETTMATKSIDEVLKAHTIELMAIPGVIGTARGLCGNTPCIKVFVIERTPEAEKEIPPTLEGYPVEIEETGEIRALPEQSD